MTRHDGRADDALREVRITRNWLDHAEGSVLVEFGRTSDLFMKPKRKDPEDYITGRFG